MRSAEFCLLHTPPLPDGLQATYDIFKAAIAYCQPGRPYSGIGGVIQEMVDARGYSTISNFCEIMMHVGALLGSVLRVGGTEVGCEYVHEVQQLLA